jgi:hypothetical protein
VAVANGMTADGQKKILINFEGRHADGSLGGSGFFNFMRIIEHLLEVPGDYNNDRYVDAADYAAWQQSFGQTGTGLAADGNDDGIVDNGDFIIWRKAFQSVLPASGLGSGLDFPPTIPEPTSSLLVVMGLFALCAHPARRRRA